MSNMFAMNWIKCRLRGHRWIVMSHFSCWGGYMEYDYECSRCGKLHTEMVLEH